MRFSGLIGVQVIAILIYCGAAVGMEYPKEIAEEFPACKGAEILQTMNIQGNMVVMMECAGSMEDIYGDYKKKVEAGGWSILMETKQPEATVLMGEKGQKRLVLNVGADGGKTMVSITVGKGN